MKIWRVIKKAVTLQRKTGHVPVVFKFEKDDSLAQLVEHNTFNVGVVGSSPTRITKGSTPKYRRASPTGGSNRIYALDFKQLAILAIPYC